jgi:hypothetical protein
MCGRNIKIIKIELDEKLIYFRNKSQISKNDTDLNSE